MTQAKRSKLTAEQEAAYATIEKLNARAGILCRGVTETLKQGFYGSELEECAQALAEAVALYRQADEARPVYRRSMPRRRAPKASK